MNLMIEFPDILLSDLIERMISNHLHESGSGYEFLRSHVRHQLQEEIVRQVDNIDIESAVRQFVSLSISLIIERAVEKELDRRVKLAVKKKLSE